MSLIPSSSATADPYESQLYVYIYYIKKKPQQKQKKKKKFRLPVNRNLCILFFCQTAVRTRDTCPQRRRRRRYAFAAIKKSHCSSCRRRAFSPYACARPNGLRPDLSESYRFFPERGERVSDFSRRVSVIVRRLVIYR